jgi:hypothetical protein
VNKAGSNAVYVVLAVAFILTASAQASSMQPAYALRAFVVEQLSLSFDDESGNFQGMAGADSVLKLRNIGSETCAFGRQSVDLEDAPSQELSVSNGVFSSPCFSPASVAISFGPDALSAPFSGRFCVLLGQDAKYRFAYLKRDLVYVRSRS